MIDPYGRVVKGMRISLTQRCNLNCIYCHHEGEGVSTDEMSCGEVIRILRVAVSLGVKRVKLTGGEPLLREDLKGMVREAVSLGLEDVAITTNGTLLKAHACELASAGLHRLNVSLPSSNPKVYRSITGGYLDEVLHGMDEARRQGLEIKLNAVIMRGINACDVDRFLALARSLGSSLQLIELENLNLDNDFFNTHYQDLAAIEDYISSRAELVVSREEMNRRKRYMVGGIPVDIVRPLNNPDFCSRCTRIRVTSDGKLKPCLMRSDNLVDLLGHMRGGCSNGELRDLFARAVALRAPHFLPAIPS